MALGPATSVGGGSSGRSSAPGSIYAQWMTVNTDAKNVSAFAGTPTLWGSTTADGHQWVRVDQPATRIAALRHARSNTGTLTGGATVGIITADRLWPGFEAGVIPTADVRLQTIDTGIALSATTEIFNGAATEQYGVVEDNAGDGWDLLGAAAFLVVVTTAAAGTTTTARIEAKVIN